MLLEKGPNIVRIQSHFNINLGGLIWVGKRVQLQLVYHIIIHFNF